jgi:hypothetical protein
MCSPCSWYMSHVRVMSFVLICIGFGRGLSDILVAEEYRENACKARWMIWAPFGKLKWWVVAMIHSLAPLQSCVLCYFLLYRNRLPAKPNWWPFLATYVASFVKTGLCFPFDLSYTVSMCLTSWSSVLLQNITVTQLSNRIPHLFRSLRFITVYTRANYWTISWSRRIHW